MSYVISSLFSCNGSLVRSLTLKECADLNWMATPGNYYWKRWSHLLQKKVQKLVQSYTLYLFPSQDLAWKKFPQQVTLLHHLLNQFTQGLVNCSLDTHRSLMDSRWNVGSFRSKFNILSIAPSIISLAGRSSCSFSLMDSPHSVCCLLHTTCTFCPTPAFCSISHLMQFWLSFPIHSSDIKPFCSWYKSGVASPSQWGNSCPTLRKLEWWS